MLPATRERVSRNTADRINRQIAERTAERIAHCADGGPEAIERRLAGLEREWDVERVLEANASSLILAGLALGRWADARFYALPAFVAGFLLQHALQGWCPPVPILRRLGVRTQSEIEQEHYALKALRGDFEEVPDIATAHRHEADRALRAVEL